MTTHLQFAPQISKNQATKRCPYCGQTWPAYQLHTDHKLRECKLYMRVLRTKASTPAISRPATELP